MQEIEGATSRSIGEEPNRRVVISSTVAPKKSSGGKRNYNNRRNGRRYDKSDKPAAEGQTEGAENTENASGADRERGERSDRGAYNRRRNDDRRRRGRGSKPEQPVSTRPAEVKEEAKDKPLYGKIEL